MKVSQVFAILSVLFFTVGASDGCDDSRSAEPDGNSVIKDCNDDDKTQLEKKECEKRNINRTFTFSGTVEDVYSNSKFKLKIDPGNYANVFVASGDASTLTKGRKVTVTGKLTDIGTGIMIYHDIREATFQ